MKVFVANLLFESTKKTIKYYKSTSYIDYCTFCIGK